MQAFFCVVPEAGLEPAQYFYRRILNPMRLPISPLWHLTFYMSLHDFFT